MLNISDSLIKWYHQNQRNLPFRNTKDPYSIWILEVILQQTRVAQGMDYYHNIISRFPNVESLAKADEHELLKLWQGLGYYSRARNLHAAAQQIAEQHQGLFPSNYNDLLQLPGVGPYTAAAIASFAFNEPVAAVDGNVIRFISRFFGVMLACNSPQGRKKIDELAQQILNTLQAGLHNQSIIEFGALQCVPRNPDCSQCPFSLSCFAYKHSMVNELPVKSSQKVQKTRYFNYFILLSKNNTCILKHRTQNDIWKNLYEFPLIETSEATPVENLLTQLELLNLFKKASLYLEKVVVAKAHQLSHQRIEATFNIFRLKTFNKELPENYIEISIEDLDKYAISRLIERTWQEINPTL
jgi:A/G-specific adenine glycosylase